MNTFLLIACLTATGPMPVQPPPQEKSPSLALLLSLVGTAVPAALAMGGGEDGSSTYWIVTGSFVVGPSLGHIYAENSGRAALGIGIRAVAALGFTAGLFMAFDGSDQGTGTALIVSGLAIGGASALIDIGTAPLSARSHNRRHATEVGVGPTLSPSGAPGVGFTVRF